MQFLSRTFQLIKGVGPWRERDLWARDVPDWDGFERARSSGVVMSPRLDSELAHQIEIARSALSQGDLATLAHMLPPREHWRLYGHFANQAAFFDIEADGDNVPTVVAVMDQQGLAVFRRDINTLSDLPMRLAASRIWVTFNGGTYDIPVLRKAFGSSFPQPLVHIDLRFLVRQAKLKGGLKGIEKTLGLQRPPHLEGVRGLDAIRLWREWVHNREHEALRILLEYNLYDAVNLRSLLEWSVWRIAELNGWSNVTPTPIFQRGDVLYDLTRLVLSEAGEPSNQTSHS